MCHNVVYVDIHNPDEGKRSADWGLFYLQKNTVDQKQWSEAQFSGGSVNSFLINNSNFW